MGDWETSELVGGAGSKSSAPPSPSWDSGGWWWHRHHHVPVAVWILASVLGGAAIGGAVEPDHKPVQTPTTIEITSEEVDAAACDTDNGAELAAASNRSSFAAGSGEAASIPCD